MSDLDEFHVIGTNDLIQAVRLIAEQHGYAIAVHGTERRDLDLIAVPWVEHADGGDELVQAICDGLGATESGATSDRPHGRRAHALVAGKAVRNYRRPSYIDLSVMPTQEDA